MSDTRDKLIEVVAKALHRGHCTCPGFGDDDQRAAAAVVDALGVEQVMGPTTIAGQHQPPLYRIKALEESS